MTRYSSSVRRDRRALALVLTLRPSPARAQFQPRTVERPGDGRERTTSKARRGTLVPVDRHVRSRARRSTSTGTHDRFQERPRPRWIRSSPSSIWSLRPAVKHKFRAPVHPARLRAERRRLRSTTRLQRPDVTDVGLPVNSKLDWKAWRFGYEYDFVVTRSRLRRVHRRRQVHRRRRVARQPDPIGLHRTAAGADPGDRRHLPRLSSCRTSGDHGRDHRASSWLGPSARSGATSTGTTLDFDFYGDGELHQQHRRAGRLPVVRRRLRR